MEDAKSLHAKCRSLLWATAMGHSKDRPVGIIVCSPLQTIRTPNKSDLQGKLDSNGVSYRVYAPQLNIVHYYFQFFFNRPIFLVLVFQYQVRPGGPTVDFCWSKMSIPSPDQQHQSNTGGALAVKTVQQQMPVEWHTTVTNQNRKHNCERSKHQHSCGRPR